MKDFHTRDDKDRLRISNSLNSHMPNEKSPRIVFMGDHMVVCGKSRFEKLVSELGAEIGSEEVARTVLEGESMELRVDNQGRTVIPQEYLVGDLAEREVYIISVKGKTEEDNYLDIFPKKVYDKIIEDFFKGTTFLAQSGLKGKIKEIKGNEYEEGRRKD